MSEFQWNNPDLKSLEEQSKLNAWWIFSADMK